MERLDIPNPNNQPEALDAAGLITNEEFAAQYGEEHVIENNGETVSYFMVEPETLISDKWVVYVGGFGQGPSGYETELRDLAQSGRKVLFTNPVKGFSAEGEEEDLAPDVPETIKAKARAVKAIIEQLGSGAVDIVGHSQGGAIAATVELMYPGSTEEMVLDAPAGMYDGEDSLAQLAKRGAADSGTETLKAANQAIRGNLDPAKDLASMGQSFTKETRKEFFWRLKHEVPGVAEVDLPDILRQIKAQRDEDSEQRISLVNPNNDKIYPAQSVEAGVGFDVIDIDNSNEEIFKHVDRWAMRPQKNDTHNSAIMKNPGMLRSYLNGGPDLSEVDWEMFET